jgi:hypothetical protein
MVLFVKERNLELCSDELVVQETGLRRYGRRRKEYEFL